MRVTFFKIPEFDSFLRNSWYTRWTASSIIGASADMPSSSSHLYYYISRFHMRFAYEFGLAIYLSDSFQLTQKMKEFSWMELSNIYQIDFWYFSPDFLKHNTPYLFLHTALLQINNDIINIKLLFAIIILEGKTFLFLD